MEFKEEQKRLAVEHRKAWEVDIQEKHRLERMTEAKDALAKEIMTRRAAVFARLKVHFGLTYLLPFRREPVVASHSLRQSPCKGGRSPVNRNLLQEARQSVCHVTCLVVACIRVSASQA